MTRRMSALEARRQLSFLKSFDRKFQVLDRELQRLNRARQARSTASGGWPIDGLERTVKSLIGAGAVYGLAEISTWAREFLDALGKIRSRKSSPKQTEMDWLAARIRVLETMQREAVERAEEAMSGRRDSNPEARVKPADEEDTWESAFSDAGETDERPSRVASTGNAARQFIQKGSLGKQSDVLSESSRPISVNEKKDDVAPSKLRVPPAKAANLFAQNAPHVLDKASSIADSHTDGNADGVDQSIENAAKADDFAGSSDTMPVDIVDIVEVSEHNDVSPTSPDSETVVAVPASMPNMPVRSPFAIPKTVSIRRRVFWPVAAATLLLFLGVSVYFNFSDKFESTQPSALPDGDTLSLKSLETTGGHSVTTPLPDSAASATLDTSSDVGASTGATDDAEENAPTKSARRDRRKKTVRAKGHRKNRTGKAIEKATVPSETRAATSPAETSGAANASEAGPSGRLRVSIPANAAGDIRIFVDGTKKGKAPKILSLTSGLHEVRFEMDGKSQLKMVSIKKGATTDVTPRF